MSEKDVDLRRRRFLTSSVSVVGGVGAAFTAVPFVASWQPSERAKAIGAPVEVEFGKLEKGQMLRVKWRGKPVWVLRRGAEALSGLTQLDDLLRDPGSDVAAQQPGYAQNGHRSIRPEILVLVGICTHLGCSPQYIKTTDPHALGDDWPGGFFCPCHGSKFDLAGRVYKSVPAPTNLVVPPHSFLSDTRIVIGVDQGAA